MNYEAFVSELKTLSVAANDRTPPEKLAYEQLQFDLPEVPLAQLVALKAKIAELPPLAALKAYPLTHSYVKYSQNAQMSSIYSFLSAQALALHVLALLGAPTEERDALLAAYIPEDVSEPKPLFASSPVAADPTTAANGSISNSEQPAPGDDTEDVYLDVNDEAADLTPSPFHSHAAPAAPVSTTDKLTDLAAHASYATLSRGSTWDELRLDTLGPTLYAMLCRNALATASLHWLGVLTERLLEYPQSAPALIPSLTAALQIDNVSHVEVIVAAMSSLAHRVSRTSALGHIVLPIAETLAAAQPFLAQFTANAVQSSPATPEHIADFSHILRACTFAAQAKGAGDTLLKSGLMRDTVMFFLRTQRQADAFIFHDQLLHVCCASATFRNFILRVPEVVEAVTSADVKSADSVVWHILLSLVTEEEAVAAHFYEVGCEKLAALSSSAAGSVNWPFVKRVLQLFSALQKANSSEWRWRVLVNRWHPMGDAALLSLLIKINEAAKAQMTTLRPTEEKEGDKPDTSVKKDLKILSAITLLLKTLYGDDSRGSKNE